MVACKRNDKFKGRMVGSYRVTETELGEGSTGTVLLSIQMDRTSYAALKIVSKKSTMYQETLKEIRFLHKLNHKNIISVENVQEDEENVFLFTPFLEERDIYTFMQRHGTFDEFKAFRLFKQMISALEYSHGMKVCHHDFKLENCVIDSHMNLKVIDFGYSVEISDKPGGSQLIRKYNCSPAYSALEILFRRPHTESVDIFSLGTCLFYMLTGYFPFCDEQSTSFEELCRNVRAGIIDFPDHLSSSVRDLLQRMLSNDNRPNWNDIRNHPWFVEQKHNMKAMSD